VRDSFRVLVYAERDPALRDVLSDHCPISVRLDAR
jgi:endonuclease/exonuclease/phosphatase family metal-dependent hydrolase